MKGKYILEGREPFEVLRHFEDICSIPHGSGHEAALARHIMDMADARGYAYKQDEAGNILVDIPASAGCENAPSLMIQGHIDMVLAKEPWVTLDLEKEPVELVLEGDILRANGTTLGADNGVGVCNMMALMEHPEIPHPALELLFTVSEEAGLIGMKAFDPSWVKSRMLINMDMSDPGLLSISSAGACKMTFRKICAEEPVPSQYLCFDCRIDGLLGGHSGIEMGKNRGDAVALMGRLLCEVMERVPQAMLANFYSPTVRAGIPQFAGFTVCIPAEANDAFNAVCEDMRGIFDAELVVDKAYEFNVTSCECPANAASSADSLALADFLVNMPIGPVRRSQRVLTWMLASLTMPIVSYSGGVFDAMCSYRVNRDEFCEQIDVRINSVCRLTGVEATVLARTPAWPEAEGSLLSETAKAAYRESFGEEMVEDSCHGTVEVNILAKAIPDLQIIGIAPYSRGAHTTGEYLDLSTMGPFWTFLKAIIAKLSATAK